MAFYGYRLNRLILNEGRVEVWPYCFSRIDAGQYEGRVRSYCPRINRRQLHAGPPRRSILYTQGHNCGYHAFRSLQAFWMAQLEAETTWLLEEYVLFRCALWGKVEEHEFGYRAEYCRLVAMLPAATEGSRWLRLPSYGPEKTIHRIGYAPWHQYKGRSDVEPLDPTIPERWAAEHNIEVLYMPLGLLLRRDGDADAALREWLVETGRVEGHEDW